MSYPTTGAVSLKKSHHIITLRFSEEVKDHAKFFTFSLYHENVINGGDRAK